MRLRLDPTMLDGRSSAGFDARTTTLGLLATTPNWNGQTRIVPGDPTHSLLVKLISNRGTDNPVDNQMPPIATSLVDTVDTQVIIDWIGRMPGVPIDAGADAAIRDAMADATPGAEASTDAGVDATLGDGSADAAMDSGAE